jgi:hypothetical protein
MCGCGKTTDLAGVEELWTTLLKASIWIDGEPVR